MPPERVSFHRFVPVEDGNLPKRVGGSLSKLDLRLVLDFGVLRRTKGNNSAQGLIPQCDAGERRTSSTTFFARGYGTSRRVTSIAAARCGLPGSRPVCPAWYNIQEVKIIIKILGAGHAILIYGTGVRIHRKSMKTNDEKSSNIR